MLESEVIRQISKDHCLTICTLVEKQPSLLIDLELVQQWEMERDYWFKVLTKIVALMQFLAESGLAFRGYLEIFGSSNNGNYLGCLEFTAQFGNLLISATTDLSVMTIPTIWLVSTLVSQLEGWK